MTGVVVRLVLVVVCLGVGVRLLMVAGARRRQWLRTERALNRAEAWWAARQGGPFDQTRTEIPDDVVPFLGANGPRSDLHEPAPALAHLVWGFVLLGLAVLIGLSALAQLSSGLS